MLVKRKLPIYIVSLVSIPLIFLAITLYVYLSKNLHIENEERMHKLTAMQSNHLQEVIDSEKSETELMAHQDIIVTFLRNEKEGRSTFSVENQARNFLSRTAADSEKIQISFVTDLKGNIVLSNNWELVGTKIAGGFYFERALNKSSVIANIVEPISGLSNIVVSASPIYDYNGEFIGVLGNILDLKYFKNKVLNTTIGDTGYFYLVDSYGKIISHPENEKIGQMVENEKVSDLIKSIYFSGFKGTKVDLYNYRGKEKFMGYTIIPELNWVLVATQNVSEIRESALLTFYIISSTTILLIILSSIISLRVSKSITKPIDEIMNTMQMAADGDLSVQSDINTKDELGNLSTCFNVMINKLNLSYDELSALYEQIAATEEELRAQYEELQSSEEALRNSDDRYKLALECTNDAIWDWDLSTRKFYASDRWVDIVGGNHLDNLNLASILEKLIHPEDSERFTTELWTHINGNTPILKSEIRIQNSSKEYIWVYIRGKGIRSSSGEVVKMIGSIMDISDRKKSAQEIEHLAYYDLLTELPNRIFFMKKLEEEIENSRYNGTKGKVMLIDLDNFKNINDTLGHDYGDMLIKEISNRLNSIKMDGDTIYRFGGDGFIILRTKQHLSENVASFALQVLELIEENYELGGKKIFISGSIGIATYPDDGDTVRAILKNVDSAMYKAKELGKNRFELFNSFMHDELQRKLQIEEVLRKALAEDGFILLYQPQYNAITKQIAGFEALLRINSEKYGFFSPAEFIPIAEKSGLIIQIGEWVLRKACEKNSQWKKQGYSYENISVNISSVQLEHSGFIDMVKKIIHDTGLSPEYLELEITETILMKSINHSVGMLTQLRSMGIKLALDDFGTGYSSLNYLKRIPIDTLKMDKSFIDGICLSKKEEAIVSSIIDMAHIMELSVVAEGVELEEQLSLLHRHHCDKIQGYLLNKPLSEDKAEEALKNYGY